MAPSGGQGQSPCRDSYTQAGSCWREVASARGRQRCPAALAPSPQGGGDQASGLTVALRGRPRCSVRKTCTPVSWGSPTGSNPKQPTSRSPCAVTLLQLCQAVGTWRRPRSRRRCEGGAGNPAPGVGLGHTAPRLAELASPGAFTETDLFRGSLGVVSVGGSAGWGAWASLVSAALPHAADGACRAQLLGGLAGGGWWWNQGRAAHPSAPACPTAAGPWALKRSPPAQEPPFLAARVLSTDQLPAPAGLPEVGCAGLALGPLASCLALTPGRGLWAWLAHYQARCARRRVWGQSQHVSTCQLTSGAARMPWNTPGLSRIGHLEYTALRAPRTRRPEPACFSGFP